MSSETEDMILSQRGALRFSRVVTPVENMQIWHATVSDYSFVIRPTSIRRRGL
jgi:hypothetical protein